MRSRRVAAVRSWLGVVAALVVVVSAATLTVEYLRAARVEGAEKALVEDLKERARPTPRSTGRCCNPSSTGSARR
jgi:hypothetical protein